MISELEKLELAAKLIKALIMGVILLFEWILFSIFFKVF
jgi:hypothetical protein